MQSDNTKFKLVGKGIGQASRLTRHAADAGAMPWTACILVMEKVLMTRASAADGGVRTAVMLSI